MSLKFVVKFDFGCVIAIRGLINASHVLSEASVKYAAKILSLHDNRIKRL